jgi:putative ABC transport system permease protein
MDAAASKMIIRLSWRNVVRNWRHSFATIAAIASGFTAVSLFDGFIADIEARNRDGYQIRGMYGNVVIQKKDAQHLLEEDFWAYTLDAKDQAFIEDKVKTDPDVEVRVRFLSITGLVNAGRNNAIFLGNGFDLEEAAKLRGPRWVWNATAGKPLHLGATPSAMLSGGLGRLLDCESTYEGPSYMLPDGNYVAEERPFTCKHPRVTFSATTEAAQVNAVELPVTGLFDAGFRELDLRAVSLPLSEAQRLLDTDKLTMVTVLLKPGRDEWAFVRRMREAAAALGLSLDVLHWTEHKASAYVRGGFEILYVFRNLFMGIVVAIGVMSVANTMMKSVNERIREIGTLRSLGFRRRQLVSMFSLEGMFLSAIACGVGLVLTLVLTFIISEAGIMYKAGVLAVPIQLRLALAPVAWLASAAVLSLLATGTAWFCSRRAARLGIADAMRHV